MRQIAPRFKTMPSRNNSERSGRSASYRVGCRQLVTSIITRWATHLLPSRPSTSGTTANPVICSDKCMIRLTCPLPKTRYQIFSSHTIRMVRARSSPGDQQVYRTPGDPHCHGVELFMRAIFQLSPRWRHRRRPRCTDTRRVHAGSIPRRRGSA